MLLVLGFVFIGAAVLAAIVGVVVRNNGKRDPAHPFDIHPVGIAFVVSTLVLGSVGLTVLSVAVIKTIL